MNALDVVLFNRRAFFDPAFVLQNGGILIGLKTDSETTRCDKLGIASLSVSNSFAALNVARGNNYAGASKRNGGTMFVTAGLTNPTTRSAVHESYSISTGGTATNLGNIAVAQYGGAGAGGEIYYHMISGSDGTNSLTTIYRKLIDSSAVPTVISQTCTAGFMLEAHSTETCILIVYGITLSTTAINQTDLFFPYSSTNSALYHSNPYTNSAGGRAVGGNESRMITVGGRDGSGSNFYATMEETAIQSRAVSRSWGTLGTARAEMGMAGSQFRQIITNGRLTLVTASTGRDYLNMESHTLNASFDTTAASFWGAGTDSGSN